MKIELTNDEVNTILAALALYRDDREDAWLSHGRLSYQEEAGSAAWCQQKIRSQAEISVPVDPFGMPSEEA